jgi:hypothetical protein
MQGYKSNISFVCPRCQASAISIIEVPAPPWGADRASEKTAEDETDVKCGKCGADYLAHVQNTAGYCDVSLHEYPNVEIQAGHSYYDGPDEEPWVDYTIPDYPYGIFMDSYHETGNLLADRGGDGASLINRMIFVQQVGALEAYLGDTLIHEAINNHEVILNLLAKDTELKSKKYSLEQIAANPDLVKSEVRQYLKSIIFHNIPRVRELYRIVCGFDLYALLAENKDALFRSIEYRHDCVHRNGRDKDGNQLDVFTRKFVQEHSDRMRGFVASIQRELIPKPKPLLSNEDFPF